MFTVRSGLADAAAKGELDEPVHDAGLAAVEPTRGARRGPGQSGLLAAEGYQHPVNPANPYYNGNGPRWGWPTVGLLPPPPNSRIGPWTPPSYGNYGPT